MRLSSALPLLQPLVFSSGLWLNGTVHSRMTKEWLVPVSIEGFCPVQASRVLNSPIRPTNIQFYGERSFCVYLLWSLEDRSRACLRLKDGQTEFQWPGILLRIKSI